MFSQKGFHVYWVSKKDITDQFAYFQVPPDLIFDPYENPTCFYDGDIELELPKEAVDHSLNVWCPGNISKLHFVCRYQNEVGKCKVFYPLASEPKIVPSKQPAFEIVKIPTKSQSDEDIVIYGTFSYFLVVSALLIRKMT